MAAAPLNLIDMHVFEWLAYGWTVVLDVSEFDGFVWASLTKPTYP